MRLLTGSGIGSTLLTMDGDDFLPRMTHDTAQLLGKEDIDPLSPFELDERIALLKAEIARCEARKDYAQSQRASADALFRKS